jgi:hypothetical protein
MNTSSGKGPLRSCNPTGHIQRLELSPGDEGRPMIINMKVFREADLRRVIDWIEPKIKKENQP